MVRANIQYSKTGVIPPVYLAGSFTEWQPSIEMQQEIIEEQPSRQYRFSTSVEVDPGEYQYKLRLGPGDWWTTDETVPTVTDAAGNVNNIIVIKDEAPTEIEPVPEQEKVVDDNELIHEAPQPSQPMVSSTDSKSSPTTDSTTVEAQPHTSTSPVVTPATTGVEETGSTPSAGKDVIDPKADDAESKQDAVFKHELSPFWKNLIGYFSRYPVISFTFAAAAAVAAAALTFVIDLFKLGKHAKALGRDIGKQ